MFNVLIIQKAPLQATDGADDGGIDFFYQEDDTFLIIQTKYSEKPRKSSVDDLLDEIKKIWKTLTIDNPNRRAQEFVNALHRKTKNTDALLEILWLTTNVIPKSALNTIQKQLEKFKRNAGWRIGIDFASIDHHVLDKVIYDNKHGYIPQTGKKKVRLDENQWIDTDWEDTGVYSLVCIMPVNDFMKWFVSSHHIQNFLQKNVREFLGEATKINKDIARSYRNSPEWFWYKHNGIIVFADSINIDPNTNELFVRNPQVVNGGQTLNALFSVYDKNRGVDNPAKVLVRLYRLPYENTETYRRSIDIISALNSQHKISSSDLHSTDPQQVRLERLFQKVGDGYRYYRKRSKRAKSGDHSITMRNLALRYYVCKKYVPQLGVKGNIEDLFEDEVKYNYIFNEAAINKEITMNHVVINYITVWTIDRILQDVDLPRHIKEYFQYTRWYVLADIYTKLMDWQQNKFTLRWHSWIEFLESTGLKNIIRKYCRQMFSIAMNIVPKDEQPRRFLLTPKAKEKFQKKSSVKNLAPALNKQFRKFQKESYF